LESFKVQARLDRSTYKGQSIYIFEEVVLWQLFAQLIKMLICWHVWWERSQGWRKTCNAHGLQYRR